MYVGRYVCMYACMMHACMYVYLFVCLYTDVCMCAYEYLYIYLFTYLLVCSECASGLADLVVRRSEPKAQSSMNEIRETFRRRVFSMSPFILNPKLP